MALKKNDVPWCCKVVARWVQQLLPKSEAPSTLAGRQRHLDPSALATPSLALACAVREATIPSSAALI